MFPNENMRPIQYPLDRSQGLTYDTGTIETIDSPFEWSTTDSDARVSVTLTLSLNEYVALASAIDVGRDIAYGQASLAVWWLWVRCINTMDFCEQVDNCIANDPDVIITINKVVGDTGIINPDSIDPIPPLMNDRFPPSDRTGTSSPPPPACDKDALWTGILEIVTRLDGLSRDFLETVVAYNDKAERIANIIDLVPIFGDIAADVITIFSDVAPDLLNAYNAHSTSIVLDDTACALFELVCQDCRYPTFDEVYDHYSNFGIAGIQDIAGYGVTAAMDYMIGSNNLANAVVWYTMQSITLYTLYLGSTWANRRGTKWLAIWADIGEDAPNNGWELLCNGCTGWCSTEDFTTGALNWIQTAQYGAGIITVNGWQYTDVVINGNEARRSIFIEKSFDATNITSIDANINMILGNMEGNNVTIVIRTFLLGVETIVVQFKRDNFIYGNDVHALWSGSKTADKISVFFRSSRDTQSPYDTFGGDILLMNVKICGDGIQPPQFP